MKQSELRQIIREEIKRIVEDDVPLKHQTKIAKANAKMHPAMAAVLGGPSPDEASKWLKQQKQKKAAKKESITESLTKKDFIAMAKYIKNVNKHVQPDLIDFAVFISKQDNPRFDEKRFRDFIEAK